MYVSRGVEQFKKGECQQALNFYNQALDLDNENVDALVARGALYNSRYIIWVFDPRNDHKTKLNFI